MCEGILIPQEQWTVYEAVIREARARGLRFALGGAFGVATYPGMVRNTKDMDLFVLPRDRDAMIAALTATGMEDYYGVLPYDRAWIFRAHADGTIVDVIWAMANRHADVDEGWPACSRYMIGSVRNAPRNCPAGCGTVSGWQRRGRVPEAGRTSWTGGRGSLSR